jgi:hypothetical protein
LEDDRLFDLVPHLAPHERFETWWFVDTTARPRTYGDGGVAVLETVALTRPVGRLLRTLRLVGVMTAVDHVVSRFRNKLNRIVPEIAPPARFP